MKSNDPIADQQEKDCIQTTVSVPETHASSAARTVVPTKEMSDSCSTIGTPDTRPEPTNVTYKKPAF